MVIYLLLVVVLIALIYFAVKVGMKETEQERKAQWARQEALAPAF